MTEEKKATTKKPTAAQVKAAEKKAAEAKAKEEAETVKEEKRKIDKDTEVTVYNNTSGLLYYSAKKGNGFLDLAEFMDSDEMTVEELQQMRNSHRAFLEKGWLFVDDEEVLKYLKLDKVIDTVASPEVLKNLVENNEATKIMEIADKLTLSSRESLNELVKKAYLGGRFGNAHAVKAVEKAANVHPDDSVLLTEA